MTHYPDCRNPVLPPHLAIPDPEARVMPDGRVYIYGSWDQTTDYFCSHQYRVVSSADLVDWVDHGESFSSAQVPWVHDEAAAQRYPGVKWFSPEHATPFVKGLMDKARSDPSLRIPKFPKGLLFAPDAIHRNGRYYLYFCMPDQTEGVAVASHPAGPFADARQLACSGIDPAVFIDDDGQAYLYWGQFSAQGARLNADMLSIDEASITPGLLTEAGHHFHEGSSVRKRGGVYYFIYTSIERGKPTSLSYATSTSPLGPFKPRGVIIDNAACDPKSWNNHGSIECVNGRWHVFYHRSSRRSQHWRRLCIEPIAFEADGAIREVAMSSIGAGRPFALDEPIPAWRACEVQGQAWIGPADHGSETLHLPGEGDGAVFRQVDWASDALGWTLQVDGSGLLSLEVDGAPCGQARVVDGQVVEASLQAAGGLHVLRLRCVQGQGLRLHAFTALSQAAQALSFQP